jgi:hypothetical protein
LILIKAKKLITYKIINIYPLVIVQVGTLTLKLKIKWELILFQKKYKIKKYLKKKKLKIKKIIKIKLIK